MFALGQPRGPRTDVKEPFPSSRANNHTEPPNCLRRQDFNVSHCIWTRLTVFLSSAILGNHSREVANLFYCSFFAAG